MKLIRKSFLAMMIILATFVVMPQMQNKVEAAVKISETKKTMYKGYTYKLKITGTKKEVKWSSSDKSKATVNSKGKVYTKKNGKVTITAKVGGKKYKCKVTVKNKPYKLTQFSTTFYDLKDVAKEYRDVKNIKNFKDFVFDLDGDGKKDTIRLKNTGNETYELQYNGKKFLIGEITYADTVYIADLNKNDKTREIIVRSIGTGDMVDYFVYSIIGNKIKLIDKLYNNYCDDIEMKIDKKGKFVVNNNILEKFSPKVFSEFYEFKNNIIKTKKLDINKLKNVKFKTTHKLLFTTNMKNVWDFYKYQRDEDTDIRDAFKRAGIIEGNYNSFSILGIEESGAVKVKIKNGTKGYLFTVAGFLAG